MKSCTVGVQNTSFTRH